LGDDLTRIERIGLEAGPLSEYLVRELSVLGIVVTLLETRQVRGIHPVRAAVSQRDGT